MARRSSRPLVTDASDTPAMASVHIAERSRASSIVNAKNSRVESVPNMVVPFPLPSQAPRFLVDGATSSFPACLFLCDRQTFGYERRAPAVELYQRTAKGGTVFCLPKVSD